MSAIARIPLADAGRAGGGVRWCRAPGEFLRHSRGGLVDHACDHAGVELANAFQPAEQPGDLIPSGEAAALLIGTLIPAMALWCCSGGGSRSAAPAAAPRGCTSGWCSSSRWSRRSRRCWWRFSPRFLFQSGVEFWFSDNSRGILENANELARGYYDQNQRDVGEETDHHGRRHARLSPGQTRSPARASEESYLYQVVGRELSESAILQKAEDGELLHRRDRRSGRQPPRASRSRRA